MSNELTFYDREKLQYWLRTKQSLRKIAKLIGKDHSVLSREIRRNNSYGRKGYRADIAQKEFLKRRHKQRRGKLDKCPELKEYVIKGLKNEWSPDVIAGRLRNDKPKEVKEKTISHESIYYYIYNKSPRWEKLHQYLRSAKPRRQKRHNGKRSKTSIKERISISMRPEYISQRERYGDWESDSVIFSKQKTALSVQLERKSRLVRMHKVTNKTGEETKNALIKSIESLPNEFTKTITFDNGTENVKHIELKEIFNLETYFCDPFSSWQKGGVENANKLIRHYLPRNIDLSKLTDRDIYEIQEKLNNRPRKSLNYQTPNEVINNYLKVVHA